MPQTNLSNIQTVIFPRYWLSTYHTLAIVRLVMIVRTKRLMRHAFEKKCNIFFGAPCHDVYKQMPSLLNHRILHESTDKAIKYTYCHIHIACHYQSHFGNPETCFRTSTKRLMRHA